MKERVCLVAKLSPGLGQWIEPLENIPAAIAIFETAVRSIADGLGQTGNFWDVAHNQVDGGFFGGFANIYNVN